MQSLDRKVTRNIPDAVDVGDRIACHRIFCISCKVAAEHGAAAAVRIGLVVGAARCRNKHVFNKAAFRILAGNAHRGFRIVFRNRNVIAARKKSAHGKPLGIGLRLCSVGRLHQKVA